MQFFLGCIVISARWVSFAEACTSEAFHVWDDPCRLIDNSSVLFSDFSIPRQARTFGGKLRVSCSVKLFFFSFYAFSLPTTSTMQCCIILSWHFGYDNCKPCCIILHLTESPVVEV